MLLFLFVFHSFYLISAFCGFSYTLTLTHRQMNLIGGWRLIWVNSENLWDRCFAILIFPQFPCCILLHFILFAQSVVAFLLLCRLLLLFFCYVSRIKNIQQKHNIAWNYRRLNKFFVFYGFSSSDCQWWDCASKQNWNCCFREIVLLMFFFIFHKWYWIRYIFCLLF